MNSVEGYKGFITFLVLSGILFTVLFGFNYISKTQNTNSKASISASIPLNTTSQNVTETSAEITWTTQDESQGIVAFTMSNTLCSNETLPCTEVKELNATSSHNIKLINLNSNTEYYFFIKTLDNKYYPPDQSLKFTTKRIVEPLSRIETSILDESSGITIIDEGLSTDFDGISNPVFNSDNSKGNKQPTFETLLDDNNVLGKNTSVVDQMVTKEFKDAVIFNDTKYDFNKDGSVTVADYPLFIEFINNRED